MVFFKKQKGILFFKAFYVQMVITHKLKPPCSCERASQYILRMKFLKAISQTWRGHHSEHGFSLGNSCPEFSVLLSPLCNTRHVAQACPLWIRLFPNECIFAIDPSMIYTSLLTVFLDCWLVKHGAFHSGTGRMLQWTIVLKSADEDHIQKISMAVLLNISGNAFYLSKYWAYMFCYCHGQGSLQKLISLWRKKMEDFLNTSMTAAGFLAFCPFSLK